MRLFLVIQPLRHAMQLLDALNKRDCTVLAAMQTKTADQSKTEQKAEGNGASRPADERQELQSEEQAKEVASDIKKDAEAKGEKVQVHLQICMGMF